MKPLWIGLEFNMQKSVDFFIFNFYLIKNFGKNIFK